jgi:hypothetical protein
LNLINVSRFSAWAPGVETGEAWQEWAAGSRLIEKSAEKPDISFTSPLFRRRLSQISRMTVRVIHDLLEASQPSAGSDMKVCFLSFRGEVNQQYKINKQLIEEGEILPAAFSLSTFNVPPALASIALGLHAGYTALYPANDSFETGLITAQAQGLTLGRDIIFVYADELVPTEYESLISPSPEPLAFACVLSTDEAGRGVPLAELDKGSPTDFLRSLILYHAAVH